MLKVLSNILCDLDPKVKVIGQKAGICDGVPSTSALAEQIKFMYVSVQSLHNSHRSVDDFMPITLKYLTIDSDADQCLL